MAAEDWIDLAYDEEAWLEEEQMGRDDKMEEFVVFHDVKFVRASGKALLCEFEDGTERWVPFSQMPDGFSAEPGTEGDLEISEWLANKWDEEGPPEKEHDVVVTDVTVLRESDKALQIRAPGLDPTWIPKTHIRKHSPVLHDGDRGDLVVSPWIAEQKDLTGDAAPAPRSNVSERAKAPVRKPSQRPSTWTSPAEAKKEESQLDLERPGNFGDDDIPF